MIQIANTVHRKTTAFRYEKGKHRQVIISIAPPAKVGFRLMGTRQTYWLEAEVGYEVAVRQFLRDVEVEAKKIKKEKGCSIQSARSRARNKLRKGE